MNNPEWLFQKYFHTKSWAHAHAENVTPTGWQDCTWTPFNMWDSICPYSDPDKVKLFTTLAHSTHVSNIKVTAPLLRRDATTHMIINNVVTHMSAATPYEVYPLAEKTLITVNIDDKPVFMDMLSATNVCVSKRPTICEIVSSKQNLTVDISYNTPLLDNYRAVKCVKAWDVQATSRIALEGWRVILPERFQAWLTYRASLGEE